MIEWIKTDVVSRHPDIIFVKTEENSISLDNQVSKQMADSGFKGLNTVDELPGYFLAFGRMGY